MRLVPIFGALAVVSCSEAFRISDWRGWNLADQYRALDNSSVVNVPFDVRSTPKYPFDPYNTPAFNRMAVDLVGAAWTDLIKRLEKPTPVLEECTAKWSKKARADCSLFRDLSCQFSAVYPGVGVPGAEESQYSEDPWLVMEETAHVGYQLYGEYRDLFGPLHNATADVVVAEALRDAIENWRLTALNKFGTGGTTGIIPNQGFPSWDDYVMLRGNIEMDKTPSTEASPYHKRQVSGQFWGSDKKAKKKLNAYENLIRLFTVQRDNTMGASGGKWNHVLNLTDLLLNVETNSSLPPFYENHEDFHDLRKRLRATWRTMQMYPMIMPLAYWPLTLPASSKGRVALWDVDGLEGLPIALAGGSATTALELLFRNEKATNALLAKELAWPLEIVTLGNCMALGGFYHYDLPETQAKTPATMAQNTPWDAVQRFGYINDLIVLYIAKVVNGTAPEDLMEDQEEIAALWDSLQIWLARNDLLAMLDQTISFFPAFVPDVVRWLPVYTLVIVISVIALLMTVAAYCLYRKKQKWDAMEKEKFMLLNGELN